MQRRRNRRGFYLVSSAGVPNYGDEFITRAWLDWLARRHPNVPVWLDCLEPGRANHLFKGVHPRLQTTNTLWHLAIDGAGPSLRDGAEWAADRVAKLGSPRYDLGLLQLRDVSSVHLLGGGYLNSVWPHQLLLLPALAELKRSFGVPIFATGQGLSPLDDDARASLPAWVEQFDYFETRDAPSAAILGAEKGIDDAFLAFGSRRPIYATGPSPDLMILIQGDFATNGRSEMIIDSVVEFIRNSPAEGRVGVVESLPPDDAWILSRLADRGIETEFYPFTRIWADGLPVRRGQSWLSTRFHFHLLAAAGGASGLVLDVKPDYYGVKHASLLELGTGWGYVDDPSAIPMAVPQGPGAIVGRRTHLARKKAAVAKVIYG